MILYVLANCNVLQRQKANIVFEILINNLVLLDSRTQSSRFVFATRCNKLRQTKSHQHPPVTLLTMRYPPRVV